ncbi:hypothetical protein Lfu02_71110 [Longispora fulva]|uniref:DNA-binding transcriptional ArsR family regulator n=1 Tax=Longispora fulva TaxID=619741 RepID=A0A8J7GNT5_9ACTN|nr:DUF5937 family protein [Longispora fulva]MBG6141265.1 DNA-binding transcriptional ArsR family regulator [Longispora fulva]GIG62739.1 hypothetical protein Lfu02_71110 [Longispora fulva]
MTLTIELGPDPQVAFGPSPLGELIGALHVLSDPAHHPTQHAWAAAVAATLPADLADRIDAASFLWQVGRADFLVPSAIRATLAEDLDDLDALDDDTFLYAAFIPACGADRRTRRTRPSPVSRAPAAGHQTDPTGTAPPATRHPTVTTRVPGSGRPADQDPPGPTTSHPAMPHPGLSDPTIAPTPDLPGPTAAPDRWAAEIWAMTRDRARELSRARGPAQSEFVERLLTDLPGLRAWLRRLFEDCESAFFGEAWRQVRVRLMSDARDKSELFRRRGLAAAVAAMSPALSVRGTRLLIDKLRVSTASAVDAGITFAPTAFGWPHLVISDEPGWRPVVQYPVAPEAVVPLDLVRRRMEALANPARMRLCWLLARGAHTTGELADAWQLTAPEVSRHLAVLHRAGLLEKERRGRYTLHRLDLAAVGRLGSDLVEALLR